MSTFPALARRYQPPWRRTGGPDQPTAPLFRARPALHRPRRAAMAASGLQPATPQQEDQEQEGPAAPPPQGEQPHQQQQPQPPRAPPGPKMQPPTQPMVDLPTDVVSSWSWTGEDRFSDLGDRRDAPPLPLPGLGGAPKRVVLVRHGQSTWNARNRIQGSSDFSVLTDTGYKQAGAAGKLLRGMEFDVVFQSPLLRAEQTADHVWRRRPGPRVVLPQLREIDLYSFQGLEKVEAKFTLGEVYRAWQSDPANFELDGHAPVRELWYRASLAWQLILGSDQLSQRGLVVAHNAVNQALICTALGLPPPFFRRLTQTNAGFTVLDFTEGRAGQTQVFVERLNQLPELTFNMDKPGRSMLSRLALVCGPANGPGVKPALDMLSAVGLRTAPLIAIGSAQAQALDIRTALEASLATPGQARAVVAVADAAAIQTLIGWCLEGSPEGGGGGNGAAPGGSQQAQQQQQQWEDGRGVGARFHIDPGSVTILHFLPGVTSLSTGGVMCTNFQQQGRAQ